MTAKITLLVNHFKARVNNARPGRSSHISATCRSKLEWRLVQLTFDQNHLEHGMNKCCRHCLPAYHSHIPWPSTTSKDHSEVTRTFKPSRIDVRWIRLPKKKRENALENSHATRSHFVRASEKQGMTSTSTSHRSRWRKLTGEMIRVASPRRNRHGVPVEAHGNAKSGEISTTENTGESGVTPQLVPLCAWSFCCERSQ